MSRRPHHVPVYRFKQDDAVYYGHVLKALDREAQACPALKQNERYAELMSKAKRRFHNAFVRIG